MQGERWSGAEGARCGGGVPTSLTPPAEFTWNEIPFSSGFFKSKMITSVGAILILWAKIL